MTNFSSAEHPENMDPLILFTPSPMVACVSEEHIPKTAASTLVTLAGIVTLVSVEHL